MKKNAKLFSVSPKMDHNGECLWCDELGENCLCKPRLFLGIREKNLKVGDIMTDGKSVAKKLTNLNPYKVTQYPYDCSEDCGDMEIDINRYYKVIGIDDQIGYYTKPETINHKMDIDPFIINKIVMNNGDCSVECYDEFERPSEYVNVGFMEGDIRPYLTNGKITLICC